MDKILSFSSLLMMPPLHTSAPYAHMHYLMVTDYGSLIQILELEIGSVQNYISGELIHCCFQI